MLAFRYKEEIILLESEMKMFLLSTERSIHLLHERRNESLGQNYNQRHLRTKAFVIQQKFARFKKVKAEAKVLFELPDYEMYDVLSECESDIEFNGKFQRKWMNI